MSKLESQSDSVEGSESAKTFSMAEPAARFLLRALQELHLADNTITVEDLHTFAEKVREDLDLMIGSEKFLREQFYVIDMTDFSYPNVHRQIADQLREKIIQAQQNLARRDREFPL